MVVRIEMTESAVRKIARQLYSGDSLPIPSLKPEDRPQEPDWWETNPQDESSISDRQYAAMRLYLYLASKAKPRPLENCFPAQFDCAGGISLRPDKAIIKTFFRDGLVTNYKLGWQLVFGLTDAGKAYAKHAGDRVFRT